MMMIDIEPNVYTFCPNDDSPTNVNKAAEIMTKIVIGVKEGKFFRVILQEVRDDPNN